MLRNFNLLRTGIHTVEDGMAAPEAVFVVEDFHPLAGAVVAAVEIVAVGFGQG